MAYGYSYKINFLPVGCLPTGPLPVITIIYYYYTRDTNLTNYFTLNNLFIFSYLIQTI